LLNSLAPKTPWRMLRIMTWVRYKCF
jgi:hypothetical protein